jgi:ureidoacrylate peracid hydrolase
MRFEKGACRGLDKAISMELTASGTALIVIDMQNSFCSEDGGCQKAGLPVEHLALAIEPCERLITTARDSKVPVIYTRYVLRSDYSDGGVIIHDLSPHLKEVGALIEDTWDIEVVTELKPAAGDLVIDKNRPSAFYAPEFEATLAKLGVKNLVVCGVTTNCCVESTVRDASQRDYKTFVVADAVAEFEEDRHRIALQSMDRLFADVVTIADVTAAWRG